MQQPRKPHARGGRDAGAGLIGTSRSTPRIEWTLPLIGKKGRRKGWGGVGKRM